MHGIPHHLLGCINLDEPTWTVGTFISAAKQAICEIRSRGKVPIVVGGTHYYVQSLLFQDRSVVNATKIHVSREELEEKWPVLREGDEAILKELRRVDPAMAERWHPNDRRKIRRSLEIWLESGRRPSELYAEQRHAPEPSMTGAIARLHTTPNETVGELYDEPLVFWLHCDQAVLDGRLRERVDRMVADGLLHEILELRDRLYVDLSSGVRAHTTSGIWAAIGYKEFEEYLQGRDSNLDQEELEKRRMDAIERTKIATRQYAKQQVRWIRRKLLPEVRSAWSGDRLFALDCSQIDRWLEDVEETSYSITKEYLTGKALPDPKQLSEAACSILGPASGQTSVNALQVRLCQLCGVTVATDSDWQNHIKSRRHKGLFRSQRKIARKASSTVSQEQIA